MGGSGVQRPFKFAKYLREFGWNPIILCPESGAYHTFDNSLAEELDELELVVHRVKGNTPFHKLGGSPKKVNFPNWLESLLRKVSTFFWLPDNKKAWIDPAFKKAQEIIAETNIDLVFSTAPPYSSLMLAAKIKHKFGIPVVMDMRDDWLHSHLNNYPTSFHFNKMKKLEADTLEVADSLITVNDNILEGIRDRFPKFNSTNSVKITHGFDPQDFKIELKETEIDQKISFLYSGIFYEDSTPKIFLKAMQELMEERVQLKYIIELRFQGKLRSEDKKLIKELGLDDVVKDLGYVNHRKAVDNLLEANILWLNIGQKNQSDKISLGKTAEYFATKKPILGLVPSGEAKKLLLNYKGSYIADPYSVNEVKKQIVQIIDDVNTENLREPDKLFIQRFDMLTLTKDLSNLFHTSIMNSELQNKEE